MSMSLFSNTPTVTVLDNRGLSVRDIAWHRHPDSPDVTNEQITHHQYNARSFLTQSADSRLGKAGLANFRYFTNLAGSVLRTVSVDNGTTVALNDAAGRPVMMVTNFGTAEGGTGNRSQAVTRTWQYEKDNMPGRPLSITEQTTGEAARITKRFVYADNTAADKALNLAGQRISQYDTAGLAQTDSIALTGVPLSITRRLLKDADEPDVMADWQGETTAAWNDRLDNEAHTVRTIADTTGAVLTTTDAKGNVQRMAYNVAGLLSGSWLTLKNGKEQPVVRSLTYSAVGQKLREEHSNGVVTLYTWEPETQHLIGIKTERPIGHACGAKVLQDLRYDYDPVGNVLSISNGAEETRFWRNQKVVPENTYVYDSLYQLVSATGREMANARQQGSSQPSPVVTSPVDSAAYTNYTRTYTYDAVGNLTRIRHSAPATQNNYTTDITISDRSNRGVLKALTKNPADVDALFTVGGQQKQLQPGQNLVWTPRNELLKVTPVQRGSSTNDQEYYRYDAGSQRVLKVSTQKTGNSTQTSRVTYLAGLELHTTTSGSTEKEMLQVITVGEAGRAQVRILHWESGKPDDISNDQARWSYDNLTCSSGLELDGDGKVISIEEYYPYGGTAIWTARSAVEADYKTFHYSGKERDATGLYYYGYRYYQPWAGRWLSADPAGAVDGLNLFRMVRNNPVTLRDADGLAPRTNAIRKDIKSVLGNINSIINKDLDLLSSNHESINKVMDVLFGDSSDSRKNQWRNDLERLNQLVNNLNVERNISKMTPDDLEDYPSEKPVAIADQIEYERFKRYTDSVKNLNINKEFIPESDFKKQLEEKKKDYRDERQAKFVRVNKEAWEKISSGDIWRITHIIIHELSHLAVRTEDYAYGNSSLSEAALLPIYQLPEGLLPENRRAKGFKKILNPNPGPVELSDIAYKNADTFAHATILLSYAASKNKEKFENYGELIENVHRRRYKN